MAMKLLTTNTSSDGDSASVFTASIDSTYKLYIFKMYDFHPDGDGTNTAFNGSIDGGSNYNVTKTTTYVQAIHNEADDTAAVAYATNRDRAQSALLAWISDGVGGENDESSAGELFLFNPSSTTYVKHFYSTIQTHGNASNSKVTYAQGYFNTTSAINAVTFYFDSEDIGAGTIKMYGVS